MTSDKRAGERGPLGGRALLPAGHSSRVTSLAIKDRMSVPGRRTDRLGHQIRVELAELLSRQVKDPRIGFATVTRVELTADLHYARVYVSVVGSPEEQQSSIEGLSSAAGFLRHEIVHRLDLRRAPELEFILDRGAEAGERIEMLLQQIHESAKDEG